MKNTSKYFIISALALLNFFQGNSQTELIVNGDFETGAFGVWNVMDMGNGTVSIDAPGTTTPISGLPTAANPTGGSFYAVTDQAGPGTHVLYQMFTVPPGEGKVTLNFEMFVNDWSGSGGIIDPIGLDHTGTPNQHIRVDLLNAGAPPFSTSPADVVANYYQGVDAGTLPNPYLSYTFDLTGVAIPGTTYMLRFGEVDNQGFLNAGYDNVSIVSEPDVIVPTLGEWGIIILSISFLIIGVVSIRYKRRKSVLS